MNNNTLIRILDFGQIAAMTLVALSAAALSVASLLAAAGVVPWVELPLRIAGETVPWAGAAVQSGLAAFLLLLSVFLPSSRRVLKLETSHRDFTVSMDDVLRAYVIAHRADRANAFRMTSEFDSVRERFQHLRGHPDLDDLNAELLTMAAQMSTQSRDLAEVWSDDKVARAEASLSERRREAKELQERIQTAHTSIRELRRMLDDVEIEEATVTAQLDRLRESLAELGPLGLIGPVNDPANGGGRGPHLRSVRKLAAE